MNFKQYSRHMLIDNNIQNNTEYYCSHNIRKKRKIKPILKKSHNIFYPSEKDTLFWCFFIIIKDMASYMMNQRNQFQIEQQMKINYIPRAKENWLDIKKHKIKKSNLVFQQNLTIDFFIILCILEKINIFILRKKMYYSLIFDETKPINIVSFQHNKMGLYILNDNERAQKIEYITNNFVCIPHIHKPLKGISLYKIKDLKEICKRLDIVSDNKTKKEMYSDIMIYYEN